jgi:hypothetical protein
VNNVVELLALRAPTVGDLPPPNTRRWVARRKAAVVAAVRRGTITMEEALRRYKSRKRNSFPGSVRLSPWPCGSARHAHTAIPSLASAARPQIAALRSSWVDRPASTALTVLPSLPTGPNLALSLTFFAKNSRDRLPVYF